MLLKIFIVHLLLKTFMGYYINGINYFEKLVYTPSDPFLTTCHLSNEIFGQIMDIGNLDWIWSYGKYSTPSPTMPPFNWDGQWKLGGLDNCWFIGYWRRWSNVTLRSGWFRSLRKRVPAHPRCQSELDTGFSDFG